MKINGTDIRRYGAKQLTIETQPPKMAAGYEIMPKSLIPIEYEKDIPMGTMKMTLYFREADRAKLERQLSAFMAQLSASCIIEEIKGYKGKYKAYLTDSSYTKTLELKKKILELSFDGYFYDEDKQAIFDGATSGKVYAEGSRKCPCMIEVTAKAALEGCTITLSGREYTIEHLAAGKTIIIDGMAGKVLLDGANAFDAVDMWAFPQLDVGENAFSCTSSQARVKVSFFPMWL